MLFKIDILETFHNIHKKTPVLESLFNTVAGLGLQRDSNTGVFLSMLQNIVNIASKTHKIKFLFSSPGDWRGYVIMYESCFFLSFVANIQVFFIGKNYQLTREQCHFVLRGIDCYF